jgi:tetratricopeptide (TPR) repeat protein
VQAAEGGDLDRAIEEFSNAIRFNAQFADAHNNLGWALARKQNFPGAIREFRQAVLLREDYAKAYYNLGLALWSFGQKQEAEETLRRANRLDPSLILPKFLAVLEKKGE